jgi:hypothetical protein
MLNYNATEAALHIYDLDMITFRKAVIPDADLISRLVNSAYRGESSRVGWTTEAHFLDGQRTDPEKIQEIISDSESHIELAFKKGASTFIKKNLACTLACLR